MAYYIDEGRNSLYGHLSWLFSVEGIFLVTETYAYVTASASTLRFHTFNDVLGFFFFFFYACDFHTAVLFSALVVKLVLLLV